MPLNTDLSASPYYDDFDESKNFHRVIFKPEVAVQVRELNQLQAILQNQIERFGDNVYRRGTIISGCNFVYLSDYPYVKIADALVGGEPALPAAYVGHFIKDSSNLVAQVINSEDGFESTDPDLKTLYVRYLNSGADGNTAQFTSNTVLTVFDYADSIYAIDVTGGGSGFSNADTVEVVSAIGVNVTSTAAFSNGEQITATGKVAVIIGIDANTYDGMTVIKLRPVTADLSNSSVSNTKWTFANGTIITGSSSGAVGKILEVIGSGAKATLSTDGDTGQVESVTITNRGSGYYVVPHVTVKSVGLTTPVYTDLGLSAQNYVAQVKVANTANAVGNGYAFSITEGIIYQKGHFIRLDPQTVIVDKYDTMPDGVSIGFNTLEELIDYNIDPSLLDNVTGTQSEFAPGADRLKLTPGLVVVNTDLVSSNEEFFSIVDFVGGLPFRENRQTQFNVIDDEMAKRTFETSGDFVLDRFYAITASTTDQNDEGQYFNVVVDPGKAYLHGKRIETLSNFTLKTPKGVDYVTLNNTRLTADYRNYIEVDELAGMFQFNTGDQIDLYNAEKNYYSNASFQTADLTAAGTKIGVARVRSVMHLSGTQGSAEARYRLYLFDIRMNSTKNFKDVRSVFYNGTYKAVADVKLTYSPTTSSNVAALVGTNKNSLLFQDNDPDSAAKNISNFTYIYRTLRTAVSFANTGSASISLAANTDEFFAYNSPSYGELTAGQTDDVIVVPTSADIVLTDETGTVAVTSGSNVVVGTSTNFTTLSVGRYVRFYGNSTTSAIRRITQITNATSMQLNSNLSFTNAVAKVAQCFPKYAPVPFSGISSANLSVNGSGNLLTIDFGASINSASAVTATAVFDIQRVNVTPTAKTPARNRFAKIRVANSAGNSVGPWCLGVPDVFRLRNVYMSNSSTVNVSSKNVTSQFYVDHNQNQNYVDLSWLFKKPNSGLSLNANTYLLVEYDAFTAGPGVYGVTSYVSANTSQRFSVDATPLSGLGSNVHSLEVPEVYGSDGIYYDLLDCIDFRPIAANTVALANTVAGAPINPSATLSFGNTSNISNDQKFPRPDAIVKFNSEKFKGRKALVVLTQDGEIKTVSEGLGVSPKIPWPSTPNGSMTITRLTIPAYPTLPERFSANTRDILDRKIANEKYSLRRAIDRTVTREWSDLDVDLSQPEAYTMSSIGQLEQRIAQLEKFVSLNSVETDLRNRVVPSSVSPTLNRFKFGFFADDFSTEQFADITNPEFKSEVINGRLTVKSKSILVEHGSEDYQPDYTSEYSLVSQSLATTANIAGSTTNTSANTSTNTATTNTVVVYTVNTYFDHISPNNAVGTPSKTYPDSVKVVMASNSGPVTIRFYNLSVPDKITVYKGNTVVISTANAVALSNTDVDEMKKMSIFAAYSSGLSTTLTTIPGGNTGWNITKGAKLAFTHNPSTGREYTIVTEKATNSSRWAWRIDFPTDSSNNVSNTVPTSNTHTVKYVGQVYYMEPTKGSAGSITYDYSNVRYGLQPIPFVVKIRGLRPLTKHNFILQGVNRNAYCLPLNDKDLTGSKVTLTDVLPRMGADLVSDKDGKLSIGVFHFSLAGHDIFDLNSDGTTLTSERSGVKEVSITSSDNGSTCSFKIDVTPPAVVNPTPSTVSSGGSPKVGLHGGFFSVLARLAVKSL